MVDLHVISFLHTNDQRVAFLSACPRTITLRQIVAALGLQCFSKEPSVSLPLGSPSRELIKDIGVVADEFLAHNDWQTSENWAELIRNDSFTDAVTSLGALYGPKLWGTDAESGAYLVKLDASPGSMYPRELSWDREHDNMM
jgi:hypothetical protein